MPLAWPPDLTNQVVRAHAYMSDRRVSVLDDRVVFIAHAKASEETWVFFADLQDDCLESVVCERVAILPMRVDAAALVLPHTAGAEHPELVTLMTIAEALEPRVHAKDGAVIHEHCSAAGSVHGRLGVGRAFDPRVTVCVSSGRVPLDDEWDDNACGDTLVVWDWVQGAVSCVHLWEVDAPHRASFGFLPDGHFALAAMVRGLGQTTPQLQVRHGAALVNAFVELYPTSEESIVMRVAPRGSLRAAAVTTHYHYNGGCLSVLAHELLTDPDLEATSRDPKDMVQTREYTAYVRTLKDKLASSGLPSQAGNRVLITRDPDEEEAVDTESDDEEDGPAPAAADLGPQYYIADFDAEHVAAFSRPPQPSAPRSRQRRREHGRPRL